MTRFILASESPRRMALLKQIGLEFEVMPSGIDEEEVEFSHPKAYVKKLAQLKAKSVAKKIQDGVVIGADTMICIGSKIIGKPRDREDAAATLRELSGRVHEVVSGVCVIDKSSGRAVTKASVTRVKFRDLNDGLINWYVGTGEPLGKAGSYGIQERGALLVEWVRGDYSNVVGLPITTLVDILEQMNLLER